MSLVTKSYLDIRIQSSFESDVNPPHPQQNQYFVIWFSKNTMAK